MQLRLMLSVSDTTFQLQFFLLQARELVKWIPQEQQCIESQTLIITFQKKIRPPMPNLFIFHYHLDVAAVTLDSSCSADGDGGEARCV